MSRTATILVVLWVAVPPVLAQTRTWTDSTGKFTIEAEFVNVADGKVGLRKTDGGLIVVPLERLSEPDRRHVQSLSAKPAEPVPAPSLQEPLGRYLAELQHTNHNARWAAVKGLDELGPQAAPALPALIAMLPTAKENALETILAAIAVVGVNKPDVAVPAITRYPGDQRLSVQLGALEALRGLGPKAEAALPDLQRLLSQPQADDLVRRRAVEVLATAGANKPEGLVSALMSLLQDKSAGVREDACDRLRLLGARAKPAMPVLEQLSQTDKAERVRIRAEQAVEAIRTDLSLQPPAVRETVAAPAGVVLIQAVNELDALLQNPHRQVAWVRLGQQQIDDQRCAALRQWVETGNVLWLDTDLALKLGAKPFPPGYEDLYKDEGEAATGNVGRHPITDRFPEKKIPFRFETRIVAFPGFATEPGATPLLVAGANRGAYIVCAQRTMSAGLLVYRPSILGNRAYEDALRAYCLDFVGQGTAAALQSGKSEIAQSSPSEIPSLLRLFADPKEQPAVRAKAADALGDICRRHRQELSDATLGQIAAVLVDAVGGASRDARGWAIPVLHGVGPRPEVVDALIRVVSDCWSEHEVVEAAAALEAFGPAATKAVPALKALAAQIEADDSAGEEQHRVLEAAKRALKAIGGGAGPPARVPTGRHEDAAATPPAIAGSVLKGNIVVDARSRWVDAGVAVHKGQVIAARQQGGSWAVGGGFPKVDGNGHVNEKNTMLRQFQQLKLLPTSPFGCLLGRVNPTDPPFALGIGNAVASPAEGRLSLRINDKDEGLADNVGSITVEIVAAGK